MEKRTIIAVALCVLVIIIYPYFAAKFYPPKPQAPQLASEQNEILQPQAPSAQSPQLHASVPAVEKIKEEEIVFQTHNYRAVLSNRGAAIKSVELLRYKGEQGRPYKLFQAPSGNIGALAMWAPDKDSQAALGEYSVSRTPQGLVFTQTLNDGIVLSKEYNFPNDKHTIELRIRIENQNTQPTVFGYKLIGGSCISVDPKIDTRFMEIDTLVNGKVQKDYPAKIKEKGLVKFGAIAFIALKNKYFCEILKPTLPAGEVFANLLNTNKLVTGIEIAPIIIQARQNVAQEYIFYVGPNDYNELKSCNAGFEQTLYTGLFSGISRGLMFILRFLHGVVHNWGVAIILLTTLVSLCMFPLTLKSMRSMKEMQSLAPQIEELRAQYKDNAQKLNKEIMELYKKHKVNPFGGCLPMLLQMPIYIALYQGLMRAIELRDAKFLWIKDLSSEDALFNVSGFNVNLLPILAAIVMFMQQKLTSPARAMDQQQKMMAYMFPLMFGFLFYKFAAGFVLYFLTSTVLMVAYQYLIKVKPKQ
ncbi:MAG: membrane protein insertase YidC [Candidatus Omnitrophota bacterium]